VALSNAASFTSRIIRSYSMSLYAGMTVNERLVVSGRIAAWDGGVGRRFAPTRWLAVTLLHRQRLLQIRDQIFLVLDADREADDVGSSTRLHLGGVVELAVGGGSGVDHQ
jgi:hypothetical protein